MRSRTFCALSGCDWGGGGKNENLLWKLSSESIPGYLLECGKILGAGWLSHNKNLRQITDQDTTCPDDKKPLHSLQVLSELRRWFSNKVRQVFLRRTRIITALKHFRGVSSSPIRGYYLLTPISCKPHCWYILHSIPSLYHSKIHAWFPLHINTICRAISPPHTSILTQPSSLYSFPQSFLSGGSNAWSTWKSFANIDFFCLKKRMVCF